MNKLPEQPDFSIREATPADADGLLAILPRLADFDLPASRQPEHLWQSDAELLRQWCAGEAPQCVVHVAVLAGDLAGLAITSLRPELLSHEPSSHLEAIAVAKSAEGHGIGKALLQAAESAALARGAQSMTLHVFACNARARGLYERAGFDGEMMRYTKPLVS